MSFLLWIADRWFFLLPLVLGFIAIWELLPKARRPQTLLAAAVGIGSVVIAGFLMPRFTGPNVPLAFDLLFCAFSALAILAGAAMILQTNPVYAALWFALVILATCGLFLLQSAPFLAVATITVYTGAIIVTFMFVIMLAQQSGQAEYDRRSREPFLASLAGFLLLGGLLYAVEVTYRPTSHLSELRDRLQEAISLLESGEAAQIEPALARLNVGGPLTFTDLLVDEARRVPAWPLMAERAQQAAELVRQLQLAAARQNAGEVRSGAQALFALTDEFEAAHSQYLGQLRIPEAVTPHISPLTRKHPGSSYVTGLGRALFGDYLYAVELAGTLLLMATLGAILITRRQREAEA